MHAGILPPHDGVLVAGSGGVSVFVIIRRGFFVCMSLMFGMIRGVGNFNRSIIFGCGG